MPSNSPYFQRFNLKQRKPKKSDAQRLREAMMVGQSTAVPKKKKKPPPNY